MHKKGYFLTKEKRRMEMVKTKASLFKEYASFYAGITVAEFNRRFGRYDTATLERHLRLAKAIYMQTGWII